MAAMTRPSALISAFGVSGLIDTVGDDVCARLSSSCGEGGAAEEGAAAGEGREETAVAAVVAAAGWGERGRCGGRGSSAWVPHIGGGGEVPRIEGMERGF
jgi:hypothetical protein